MNMRKALLLVIAILTLALPSAPALAATPSEVSEVTPVYGCDNIHASPTVGEDMSMYFAVFAHAYNGAEVEWINFDFGDGRRAEAKTHDIRHRYADPGVYTVTANVIFSVNGKIVGAPACQINITVGADPGDTVTEEEFTVTFNETVCYGRNVSTVSNSYGMYRAGLVKYDAGNLTLNHSYTEWGPCVFGDGTPTMLRLLNSNTVVFKTMCDSMSSLGDMRVSYGFVGDGVKEANVAYLIYLLSDDLCSSDLPVVVSEGDSGWYNICLEQSILVAPSENSPALFRCDPPMQ